MEIRLLTNNEINLAVSVANETYEHDVLPKENNPVAAEQFHRYANEEYLWVEACKRQLFLWGAFEAGKAVGVGAMKSTGQITMLYVLPAYQGEGIACELLDAMEEYAGDVLHLKVVAVNVTPLSAISFFTEEEFEPCGNVEETSFCAMQYFLFAGEIPRFCRNGEADVSQTRPAQSPFGQSINWQDNSQSLWNQQYAAQNTQWNQQQTTQNTQWNQQQTTQNTQWSNQQEQRTSQYVRQNHLDWMQPEAERKKKRVSMPVIIIASAIVVIGLITFGGSALIRNLADSLDSGFESVIQQAVSQNDGQGTGNDGQGDSTTDTNIPNIDIDGIYNQIAGGSTGASDGGNSDQSSDADEEDYTILPDALGKDIVIPQDEIYKADELAYSISEDIIEVPNQVKKGRIEFNIHYPQITFADGSSADAVNEILRDCACMQYDRMYPEVDPNELLSYDPESPYLVSLVNYEITYVSDELINVAFDDHYFLGSAYLEFGDLRTRLVNVKTGEVYGIEDLISHDEKLDQLFYKKICDESDSLKEADAFTADIIGQTLEGEIPEGRYFSNLLLTKKGVNLNLTYHYGNGGRIIRGWCSEDFSDKELEEYHKDSDVWTFYQGR